MDNKESLISEWVNKAEHDFQAIETLKEHNPELSDIICYHCQQTAEKYLKAYLTKLSINFKRSHSLDYLLDLISDIVSIPSEVYDSSEILEDYGVSIRYPGDWFEPSTNDVEEAYNSAKKVREFVSINIEN